MKKNSTIGVHARELEATRIDGTRIYMAAILREWLRSDPRLCERVTLYHTRKNFNPALEVTPLYQQEKLSHWPLWTQTAFAWDVYRQAPDVLWMPLHNMPIMHRSRTRIVVTIHDLAFKKFPEHFLPGDLWLLNLQTDYVVRHADHLIAVSHSTKADLLAHYPSLKEEKVSVIHHGIDLLEWKDEGDEVLLADIKRIYGIISPYMIYLGALQPRKNLIRLVKAFEIFRSRGHKCQLVLAGADAWLSEQIHAVVQNSTYTHDIILTGSISHIHKRILLRGALVMVHPSLYEGFGLPILEAFAVNTPVVCANNSSLCEIAGNGAQYCDALEIDSIAQSLEEVFVGVVLRDTIVANGKKRLNDFGWEKAASDTLAVLEGRRISSTC